MSRTCGEAVSAAGSLWDTERGVRAECFIGWRDADEPPRYFSAALVVSVTFSEGELVLAEH